MLNDYEFMECAKVNSMEVGKKYLVSAHDAVSPMQEYGGIYPWGDRRTKVPVECLEDHRFFYTVKVLSHYTHCVNFGKSYPYKVSLMKKDIMLGETKIYETEGEIDCPDRVMEYTASDIDMSILSAWLH